MIPELKKLIETILNNEIILDELTDYHLLKYLVISLFNAKSTEEFFRIQLELKQFVGIEKEVKK